MTVAIIVEGEAELVFCFYLIVMLHPNSRIHSLVLNKDAIDKSDHLKKFQLPNPNPENVFWIISASNDNSILSAIINRKAFFKQSKVELVIGLRDVYSKEFVQKYSRDISKTCTFKTMQRQNFSYQIQQKTQMDVRKCFLYFGIMEFESWFLGMVSVLARALKITEEEIKKKLGYDLDVIDPETKFVQPKAILKEIYHDYDSKKSQVEKIVKNILRKDIDDLNASNKCRSFSCFYQKVLTLDVD